MAITAQGFRHAKDCFDIRAYGVENKVVPGSAQTATLSPYGNTSWAQLRKTLIKMGPLQIDAINTVIRSHYMPLFSRMGTYNTDLLDKHLFEPAGQSPAKRRFFEYWGHECSIMPLDHFQLLDWRREDARAHTGVYKQLSHLARKKPAFVRSVKKIIEHEGPLTSRALQGAKRGPGMWEWSENKQALEYLFWTGEITARGRRGFERLYDLTENTIPAQILNEPAPDRLTAQAILLERSICALGIACITEARDYYRLSAADASKALRQLIEESRIREIKVEGWDKPAYCLATQAIPKRTKQLTCNTLLTPFDPLVWERKRLSRLFNFNYRIEIYVPRAMRQYGYYVLPYLLGDEIVARLDIKADRTSGTLCILGAWPEHGTNPEQILVPLGQALTRLASWLNLRKFKVGRKGSLCTGLRKQLRGEVPLP